jgi:hypothetical protein
MSDVPDEERLPCPTCQGTGSSGEICTVCHDQGTVLGSRCWVCKGSGKKPCATCRGAGTVEKSERESKEARPPERG